MKSFILCLMTVLLTGVISASPMLAKVGTEKKCEVHFEKSIFDVDFDFELNMVGFHVEFTYEFPIVRFGGVLGGIDEMSGITSIKTVRRARDSLICGNSLA